MDLKSYLQKNDLTETAFASKAGIPQATINRYVRGERFPTLEMIRKLDAATEGAVTFRDWYRDELA